MKFVEFYKKDGGTIIIIDPKHVTHLWSASRPGLVDEYTGVHIAGIEFIVCGSIRKIAEKLSEQEQSK